MPVETGIPHVIQLLSDYGASIVIVGVFLYTVIRLINMGLGYLDKTLGNRKHDKDLNLRQQVGVEVSEVLHKLRADCDADRVQVIEFSNSVMSVAFLPFRYMTCTYEVYRFGKTGLGHRIDHISTSLFATFFESMERSEVTAFSLDTKEPMMGGAMYDIMKEDGNKRALCCKMMSDKDKFIGYICVLKDEPFTSNDSEALQFASTRVTSLLSILDK